MKDQEASIAGGPLKTVAEFSDAELDIAERMTRMGLYSVNGGKKGSETDTKDILDRIVIERQIRAAGGWLA